LFCLFILYLVARIYRVITVDTATGTERRRARHGRPTTSRSGWPCKEVAW